MTMLTTNWLPMNAIVTQFTSVRASGFCRKDSPAALALPSVMDGNRNAPQYSGTTTGSIYWKFFIATKYARKKTVGKHHASRIRLRYFLDPTSEPATSPTAAKKKK